eukprot:3539827-Rhodomonas_salina.1
MGGCIAIGTPPGTNTKSALSGAPGPIKLGPSVPRSPSSTARGTGSRSAVLQWAGLITRGTAANCAVQGAASGTDPVAAIASAAAFPSASTIHVSTAHRIAPYAIPVLDIA